MAEFITKCPHCDTELQVQEEWIGMEVVCPQCQKTLLINRTPPQVEAAPPEPNINPAPVVNEKNCPYCGNMINSKAVRCKFCKRDLTGNPSSIANCENNGTPVWKIWISLPSYIRIAGLFVIILLFSAICSGIFFVWNDNYLIKAWKIEKRFQTFYSDMGHSYSLSPVNVALDNMGSFFTGFFFCYGENTFRDENRLLDKVLYRYGERKVVRKAIMKNMEIWYGAQKQQAKNEGRYLDY